jgi:Mg-chelatase subunit ChlI
MVQTQLKQKLGIGDDIQITAQLDSLVHRCRLSSTPSSPTSPSSSPIVASSTTSASKKRHHDESFAMSSEHKNAMDEKNDENADNDNSAICSRTKFARTSLDPASVASTTISATPTRGRRTLKKSIELQMQVFCGHLDWQIPSVLIIIKGPTHISHCCLVQ